MTHPPSLSQVNKAGIQNNRFLSRPNVNAWSVNGVMLPHHNDIPFRLLFLDRFPSCSPLLAAVMNTSQIGTLTACGGNFGKSL
jgi:hypothetical protein